MILRYLPKAKLNKTYLIYLALYANSETELISTGQRCPRAAWDSKKSEPKDHTSELFQEIEKVKAAVLKTMAKMKADEQSVTPLTLKLAYQDRAKAKIEKEVKQDKQTKVEREHVTTLIENFFKEGFVNLKKNTRKSVKSSLNTFKRYLTKKAPNLERKDLTVKLITAYAIHLTDKEKLADSTHGQKMKDLKRFLNWMDFEGDMDKIHVKNIKPGERNIITLSQEELTAIEKLDLSGQSIEKIKARHIFLLGCYLGLRISDLLTLTPEHIKDGCVKRTLGKNRVPVAIPILPACERILKLYDYRSPKLSDQAVNFWIKEICKDAGITERIIFKSVFDGELIEEVYPKNELITAHVAGKTFITLSQDWDLLPNEIAAIVGKSLKTVLGYYLDPNLKRAHAKMIAGGNRSEMHVTQDEQQIA